MCVCARVGEQVYTFSNGAKYVGAIRNGKMHGFGSYEDPSGSKYSGDWKEGRQHGQGKCEMSVCAVCCVCVCVCVSFPCFWKSMRVRTC